MASKLCKYGCGTLLEGFDEEQRKFLEAGTGGLHTKERCQEAKAKLGQKKDWDYRKHNAADNMIHQVEEQKNDHGNEDYSPSIKTQFATASDSNEAINKLNEKAYVDHTLKGASKVKIFYAPGTEVLEEQYNNFLKINKDQIKVQGGQFQIRDSGFAIALYYEEVVTK